MSTCQLRRQVLNLRWEYLGAASGGSVVLLVNGLLGLFPHSSERSCTDHKHCRLSHLFPVYTELWSVYGFSTWDLLHIHTWVSTRAAHTGLFQLLNVTELSPKKTSVCVLESKSQFGWMLYGFGCIFEQLFTFCNWHYSFFTGVAVVPVFVEIHPPSCSKSLPELLNYYIFLYTAHKLK